MKWKVNTFCWWCEKKLEGTLYFMCDSAHCSQQCAIEHAKFVIKNYDNKLKFPNIWP